MPKQQIKITKTPVKREPAPIDRTPSTSPWRGF
jgi:hypothetical protein